MHVPLKFLLLILNVILAMSEETEDSMLCNVACFNIYNPICAGMEMENGVIDYQFFGNPCSLKRKNSCEKTSKNFINLIKFTYHFPVIFQITFRWMTQTVQNMSTNCHHLLIITKRNRNKK